MVITGPGTVFDAAKACKLSDILDGTSNTVMVVEVAGTGVNWGEPKDLDAQQADLPAGHAGHTGRQHARQLSPGRPERGPVRRVRSFHRRFDSPQLFNP